jgi:hypothetical protein
MNANEDAQDNHWPNRVEQKREADADAHDDCDVADDEHHGGASVSSYG